MVAEAPLTLSHARSVNIAVDEYVQAPTLLDPFFQE